MRVRPDIGSLEHGGKCREASSWLTPHRAVVRHESLETV